MSTFEPTEVKLKGKVVEVIDIEVFLSSAEAIEKLGEDAVVSLINRQHKADCSNKCRAKYRPSTASKKKLRQLAFELCTPDRDAELHAQLMSKMGDFDALMAFLDSLADRVKKEILADPNFAIENDDDEETDA